MDAGSDSVVAELDSPEAEPEAGPLAASVDVGAGAPDVAAPESVDPESADPLSVVVGVGAESVPVAVGEPELDPESVEPAPQELWSPPGAPLSPVPAPSLPEEDPE